MITDQNKSIIRRYIEELNRRNLAILEELVAPAFREEVRQGYQRNITAFPDYRVEIGDLIAEGHQVVLEWTHHGTHLGLYDGLPPTGKVITGHAISIYRLENGQICDARGIWDRGEVWQQLGLIPDTETILKGGAAR
jgi:steroid delta-isomerase-like uncharacterized protein